MAKNLYTWFKNLSTLAKAGIVTSALFIGGAAASPSPQSSVSPPAEKPSQTLSDRVETRDVTSEEVIPFSVEEISDASLAKGKTSVTQEGVNGTKTLTFRVTYKNGVEQSRVKVGESVTLAPVNKIVATGTYVAPALSCPNGTYVNTYGNEVCSPYQSNSAPSGATAKCVDGTYSFSQSRSGTCSHHGGVAQWL